MIARMPRLFRWLVAALVLAIIAGIAEQYDERIAWLYVVAVLGVLLFRYMKG